jgi:hypothetical protein
VKPGGKLMIDDKEQPGIQEGIRLLGRFGDWEQIEELGRTVLWERGV